MSLFESFMQGSPVVDCVPNEHHWLTKAESKPGVLPLQSWAEASPAEHSIVVEGLPQQQCLAGTERQVL